MLLRPVDRYHDGSHKYGNSPRHNEPEAPIVRERDVVLAYFRVSRTSKVRNRTSLRYYAFKGFMMLDDPWIKVKSEVVKCGWVDTVVSTMSSNQLSSEVRGSQVCIIVVGCSLGKSKTSQW